MWINKVTTATVAGLATLLSVSVASATDFNKKEINGHHIYSFYASKIRNLAKSKYPPAPACQGPTGCEARGFKPEVNAILSFIDVSYLKYSSNIPSAITI